MSVHNGSAARRLQRQTGLSYCQALGCVRVGYTSPRAAELIAQHHRIHSDGVLHRHDGQPGRHPSRDEADRIEHGSRPTAWDRILRV